MKALLSLTSLFLISGQVTAQNSPAPEVRSVKIEGFVESLDADAGMINVHQGEGRVACLKNEDSIVLTEEGTQLPWEKVRPGALITAQCLCSAGKTTVESMVLQGMKKDFDAQANSSESGGATAVVNQGIDYGVCKRATPWSLIMVGLNGSPSRVYALEKSTRCVDESGMPASMMRAQAGSLVTIRYVETAGRITATEVIVGKRKAS